MLDAAGARDAQVRTWKITSASEFTHHVRPTPTSQIDKAPDNADPKRVSRYSRRGNRAAKRITSNGPARDLQKASLLKSIYHKNDTTDRQSSTLDNQI